MGVCTEITGRPSGRLLILDINFRAEVSCAAKHGFWQGPALRLGCILDSAVHEYLNYRAASRVECRIDQQRDHSDKKRAGNTEERERAKSVGPSISADPRREQLR